MFYRSPVSRGVLKTLVALRSIPAPSDVANFNAPAVAMIWRVIQAGVGSHLNLKRHLAKADLPVFTRNRVEN